MIFFSRFSLKGFLNANTDRNARSPANYGLMDIIAALHWLQENIGAFGGDAQSVTLAGHGTGAALVHYLSTSNAVPEGKFHPVLLKFDCGLNCTNKFQLIRISYLFAICITFSHTKTYFNFEYENVSKRKLFLRKIRCDIMKSRHPYSWCHLESTKCG